MVVTMGVSLFCHLFCENSRYFRSGAGSQGASVGTAFVLHLTRTAPFQLLSLVFGAPRRIRLAACFCLLSSGLLIPILIFFTVLCF